MTQLKKAMAGRITEEMERVAVREGLSAEDICQKVREGTVVIPANINHRGLEPCGIGEGLTTKINANIGTSSVYTSIEEELQKLRVAIEAGADTIMDLSTGPELDACRKRILEASKVPVGTVPIYQAAVEALDKYGSIVAMTAEDLFQVIEKQAQDGVDFMTVHCGVTLEVIERLKKRGRIADIVSRGGSFLTGWMLHHEKENPLYEQFDRLLSIAEKYDVTLSLGDGLRPGCLADATDSPQIQELIILGELVERAREAGVQVMVEGPGHVPLNQVEANVVLEKQLCRGAPFYVLGPVVTDVAPGYDHISAAIGGAIAAAAGADFLCYVTPAEHLGLPTIEDVREGVITARIAAHAADLVKGIKKAWEWDKEMAAARKNLDWTKQIELAIDPYKAKQYRQQRNPEDGDTCSMCNQFCAMKIVGEYLGKKAEKC
ncbi:phosphomethylpyrimidine synthase ThiC [Calderihabitans maritimus]|uniref:Phosphomethylpyrimidine synthase n=1 Tax=Calderihabitans maritimus TaxID=1246530 RepID=A0A1Z5HTU4_9FIRM|nr:thiamine biosynthesis protein ThiC [Calderihabitans maritimus]